MHKDTILWKSNIQMSTTRLKEAAQKNRNTPQLIEMNYNHLRHNELARTVFTFKHRHM